jgi:transposase
MMRFYKEQHEFYCGIDLHATQMYVCVVDHAGENLLHRNFSSARPQVFLNRLAPFRKGNLVLGCESTFNWYWLADLCVAEEIPFVLGHALYLKAIHGGKKKNDKIDSEKLAMLLRGGNFPVSYVYPKEMRSTRDLMRRRTFLMRRRAETVAHIKLLHLQHNQPTSDKSVRYKANREGVGEDLSDPSDRMSVRTDLELVDQYNRVIAQLEQYLVQHAKVHDPQMFYRLKSIPGVGEIIALTMMYEIQNIGRFSSVGDFLSYARLVRGSHTSAGKRYPGSGHKFGNPYLKWSFSQAMAALRSNCPEAAAFSQVVEKKQNKARANWMLALKLGRAVYYMLKRKEAFDVRCFSTP